MSNPIKHLAGLIGVPENEFDAEAFLIECFGGEEPDPQRFFQALRALMGQRTQHTFVGILTTLIKQSFETGRPQALPLISLLESACEGSQAALQSLKSSFKSIQAIVKAQDASLLSKLAPHGRELLTYEKLGKIGMPVMQAVVELGMADHAKALCEEMGLKDPLEFRSLVWEGKPYGEVIFSSLCNTSLNGSHSEIRLLFLGKAEPGNQETLLRAMAFLKRNRFKEPNQLPQVPRIKPEILELFESKILSEVFKDVVNLSKFVLDEDQSAVYLEGFKRLTAAGVRLENGVYTQDDFGYGLGYLTDRAAPSKLEAIKVTMEALNFGAERASDRKKSNMVHSTMGDVFCNHLLDTLTRDEELSLLRTDSHLLERLSHTQDKRLLNRIANKAHIDKHLASDLGL